ncbi:MAG TPA: cell division protein ZipA [Legionellales bacterium]|nr:cell division protein ZipA [Legionellales bacterium]
MQANLSLILNVVFLGVILGMIAWKLRPYYLNKKQKKSSAPAQSSSAPKILDDFYDEEEHSEASKVDVNQFLHQEDKDESPKATTSKPVLGVAVEIEKKSEMVDEFIKPKKNIMVFLAAKGQGIFAGYDLLQTLLSCGLRYGDAGLFHRHQHATGQGPVLFSLAAATATGMFDLQNIGAMSVKGLCMFMELSGNITIDSERFQIFMQTAKQLAEELHANLLDEKQYPLTSEAINKFEHMIAETLDLTH